MSAVISESQLEQDNKKKGQRRERERERDGGLLSDLSDEIISRLTCSGDKVRFAAVCASWRRLATSNLRRRPSPSHPPWLMLPGPQGEGDEHRSLYSFSERKLYHVHLPQIQGQRCVGSGHGWITTVSNLTGELQLLDLVSGGTTHRLPSVTSLSDVGDDPVLDQQGCLKGYMCRPGRPKREPGLDLGTYNASTEFRFTHVSDMHSLFKKVIFFPSASLLFVFFNTPTILAFARLGDESWKEFDTDSRCINDMASRLTTERAYEDYLSHSYCCWFSDLVFHKGHFYVTLPPGWIMALHLDSIPPSCTCLLLRPPPFLRMEKDVIESYLVESPDGTELMQVWRHAPRCYHDPYRTVSFTVFKCCNISNDIGIGSQEEANWVKVECLGEWVLFLGKNLSLALSTNDFPELTPNSIYFTRPLDDPRGHPNDMGVFHLESETIDPLLFPHHESLLTHMTMPVWIPHTEYFLLQFAKVEEITERSSIEYDDEKDQVVKDETNEHETCHSPTGSVLKYVAQEWMYHFPPVNYGGCFRGLGKLRGAPRI